MNKEIYYFRDTSYLIPENLPKYVQADVDYLEHLAEAKDEPWYIYDNYVDLLESNLKEHVMSGKMTEKSVKLLLRRYGVYL